MTIFREECKCLMPTEVIPCVSWQRTDLHEVGGSPPTLGLVCALQVDDEWTADYGLRKTGEKYQVAKQSM